MEKNFWINRWENNQIGFHKENVNESLLNLFPKESLLNKVVFVPLCGKSVDMLWFKEQGAKVIGVELSEKAVQEFFKEHNLSYTSKNIEEDLVLHTSQNIEVYQGDIFKLPSLENVDYIYDRAALIALPPEMRKSYIEKIRTYFKEKTKIFLITLEYDQSKREGPPFSVDQKEVERHFQNYQIQTLQRINGISNNFKDNPDILINHIVYLIC